MPPPQVPGGVIPAGYYPSGGDTGCSSMGGGCDGMYGSGGGMYGGGGGLLGSGGLHGGGGGLLGNGGIRNGHGDGQVGGLFGAVTGGGLRCGGCGQNGCRFCGGLRSLRHMCVFCRGQGCSACQLLQQSRQNGQGAISLIGGGIFGALANLRPYTEAGLCSQRWFDASIGASFLGHTNSASGPDAITSRGVSGPTVLSLGDVDTGGLTTGFRLTGNLIFGGAGANIEGIWTGGHDWSGQALVRDSDPVFFSFISEFGTLPLNGFDDTDRSLQHSLRNESEYDSVELNYRRRTVWPYCRFQSSWLVGLRYIRFEDNLLYETLGENNNTVNASLPRFFSSDDRTENRMFGAQVGGDFWWNIMPGVSMGIGGKLGAMKNNLDRTTVLTANSLNTLATPGTTTLENSEHETSFFGEFEYKLSYRLSHSWAIRTAYHAVAIDEVSFGGIDAATTRQFVLGNTIGDSPNSFGSLVVQGFTVDVEYIW